MAYGGLGGIGEVLDLIRKYGPTAARIAVAAIKEWLKRRKAARRKQAPPTKRGGRPTKGGRRRR